MTAYLEGGVVSFDVLRQSMPSDTYEELLSNAIRAGMHVSAADQVRTRWATENSPPAPREKMDVVE